MLAYAAGRQRIAARHSSPSTLLIVLGVHIAALAVAMTVKMAIDTPDKGRKTEITFVDPIKPPPPPDPQPAERQVPQPQQSSLDIPTPLVPTPRPAPSDPVDSTPMPSLPLGNLAGNSPVPVPVPVPIPVPIPAAEPVRTGPRLATSASALRPPYPGSKLDSGEEAALRLRLEIDAGGRVTSVQAVGPADPAFLKAAQRHLVAKWRYQPATVDGQPVASSTVITLRFQLEE